MSPIRSIKAYANPVLWAVIGWAIAVAGNYLASRFVFNTDLLRIDEVFTGLAVGFARWMQGEFRVEHRFVSQTTELKIRNGLLILSSHSADDARRKALQDVLDAFEEDKPVHPDFRVKMTEVMNDLFHKDERQK